jgi:hypothetical protein
MLLIVEDPAFAVERAITAGAREIYPVGESMAGAWDGSRIPSATTGRSESR